MKTGRTDSTNKGREETTWKSTGKAETQWGEKWTTTCWQGGEEKALGRKKGEKGPY